MFPGDVVALVSLGQMAHGAVPFQVARQLRPAAEPRAASIALDADAASIGRVHLSRVILQARVVAEPPAAHGALRGAIARSGRRRSVVAAAEEVVEKADGPSTDVFLLPIVVVIVLAAIVCATISSHPSTSIPLLLATRRGHVAAAFFMDAAQRSAGGKAKVHLDSPTSLVVAEVRGHHDRRGRLHGRDLSLLSIRGGLMGPTTRTILVMVVITAAARGGYTFVSSSCVCVVVVVIFGRHPSSSSAWLRRDRVPLIPLRLRVLLSPRRGFAVQQRGRYSVDRCRRRHGPEGHPRNIRRRTTGVIATTASSSSSSPNSTESVGVTIVVMSPHGGGRYYDSAHR